MTTVRKFFTTFGMASLAALYGFLAFLLVNQNSSEWYDAFSWSFLMLVPYAMGALVTYLAMLSGHPLTLYHAIWYPLITTVLIGVGLAVLSFGVIFCFLIALVFIGPAAILGGVTVFLVRDNPKLATLLVMLAFMSPLVASPVEAQFDTAQKLTTTHTQIYIAADAATIWNQITTVPTISVAEQHTSWLNYVGIPRPISATLTYNGIGGERRSKFENGLRFSEIITVWEPSQQLSFTIAETSDLLPKPLDLVGGEKFDMVDGGYVLETLDDGTVLLHLTSQHVLETRFNKYGSYWTDLVLRNVQNHILKVIKARSELAANADQ